MKDMRFRRKPDAYEQLLEKQSRVWYLRLSDEEMHQSLNISNAGYELLVKTVAKGVRPGRAWKRRN